MNDYLGPYQLGPNDDEHCGIYTGDARVLAEAIPDESADLIFTDPVYERILDYEWLAGCARRALRLDGNLLAWCGTRWLFDAVRAMENSGLIYGWLAVWYQANGRSFIKSRLGHHHYAPLVWMSRHETRALSPVRDHITTSWNGDGFNHEWSKHPTVITYYLEAFANATAIVLDPFTGGGTVPAVCKMLGRRYLAFEIDPATAERARERVRNTQPPLFVPEPEQTAMDMSA